MTDVDIDIAVNKFVAFSGYLWLMHEEPDPGVFCLCRLDPESPACKRRRMQGRLLRRQQRPCGGPLAPRGARARHTHAGGAHGRGGGDSGSSDDGGGCDICGQRVCLTPRFCNICRLADAGRLVFLVGGRR